MSAADGNVVTVKIIHEADQFLQEMPAREFRLAHSVRAPYGDFWSVTVPGAGGALDTEAYENWRIAGFPKDEALHRDAADRFVRKYLPDASVRGPIDLNVPKGEDETAHQVAPFSLLDFELRVSHAAKKNPRCTDAILLP